jgi:hypothetical protein
LTSITLLILIVISGYLLSDAFFFKRLINQNKISTPEQAFAFVNQNTGKPSTTTPVPPPGGLGFSPPNWKAPLEYSPREMLTKQKYLWCDQGASLMATIVRDLGYQTRIVDLIGDDGLSHHTILEVNEQGSWKTYDTTYETQGLSYQEIAARAWSKPLRPAYRPYLGPGWLVRNNFYLKQISLLRKKILDK